MRRTSQQIIAASANDVKNNRLGLLSREQMRILNGQIDHFQARMSILVRRTVTLAILVTLAVILLSFLRVILLPVALGIEVVVVGLMLYLTTDFNRFVQQLILDRDAEAVRIIKGRTSRYTMRTHPLYHTLRVELNTYKLLDASLARRFTTGELYQYYVLPLSGVIIAAESVGEKDSHYLD